MFFERNPMNNLALPDVLFLISMAGAALVLPFVFWFSYKHAKEVRESNLKGAENIVNDVIEQSGWETRQRWVNDDTIEFIYFILGKQEPGRHLLWARVSITRQSARVIIHYSMETHPDFLEWARMIVRGFKRRGINASLDTKSSDQPDLNETGVKLLEKK